MKTKTVIGIALVDDHSMFRKGLAEIITSQGDIVIEIEAGNGQELLDKLKQQKNPPPICLLDISMPVLNGYETMLVLKKEYPTVKVLTLSMHDHEYSIIHMLKHGASGYVSKTEDPEILRNAIFSVYEHGYYHSELVARNVSQVLYSHGKANADISDKEQEFLTLCCSDHTYQQIAEMMHLSNRTIEGYRDSLFNKLHVKSRSALVMFAMQSGIINISRLSGAI